jgi:hypothetical protein
MRITAEQGEDILADPQRLKGFVADYAAAESKAERLALGRCIEYGAYRELKNAPDREAVKVALARRVYAGEGLDMALCGEALDALEAALFGAPQAGPQPAYRTRAPAPAYQQPYQPQAPVPPKSFTIGIQEAVQGRTGIAGKITRRSFIFAAAAGSFWFLAGLIAFFMDAI